MKQIPILVLFGLLIVSCQISEKKENFSNKAIRTALDLQGHRGARGLKPENTWPAFEDAIKFGMTTLELDTVVTRDSQIIIHHDSESNPNLCQGDDGSKIPKKSIYDWNLKELQSLDCGSLRNPKFPEAELIPKTRLLSLDEFFQKVALAEKTYKRNLFFNIETKFPEDYVVPESKVKEHVDLLVVAIQKAKVEDRATIQSFDLRTISYLKSLKTKIRGSALFAPSYPQGIRLTLGFGGSIGSNIILAANSVKADIISPYHLYVTREFVKEAHDAGLEVIPWTVNDKEKMRILLDLGVDGIISDYPNRLIEVFREKN